MDSWLETSASRRVEDDLTRPWFASSCHPLLANRQHPRRASFAARRGVLLALLGIAILGTAACYGPPPKPVFPEGEEDRFAGLDIALDSSGPEHILVIKTPTGGYQCGIEYTSPSFEGQDVYILIREPNNLYVYSSTNHPARLSTGIPSTTFIRVLAHQAPHNAKVDREAYRLVTLSAPAPVPVPAPAPAASPKPTSTP
jgi:hypothetical protein